MKKIDVLIYYEHVSRELESALLLKRELEKMNLSVLVYKIRWNETLSHLKFRPRIIVTPWCYGDSEVEYLKSMWIGGFSNKKIKIVSLNCEQLSGKSGEQFVVPKGNAQDAIHFAWGPYFKKLLLESGVKKDHIFVTGSIRNDFYFSPYNKVNKSKKELSNKYSLDENKKWVLLIGNFSGKNQSEEQLKSAENKGFTSIRKLSYLSKKTFRELLNWFDVAATQYGSLEFIYRPHPNENITKDLLDLQEKHKNFHVIKDLAIRDWIVNCDIAYEWLSTSAIEVSFSSNPVFSLMPFEITKDLVIPLIDKIEKIKNVSEFQENLRKFSNNEIKNFNKEFCKGVEYYYLKEPACVISAKIISELLTNNIGFFQTEFKIKRAIIGTLRFFGKNIMIKLGKTTKNTNLTVLNDVKLSKGIKDYENRIDRIYE